ncbi:MAG: tyrosine-type recombinase/integrase [Afipia sp.]|nr:tyrosine-type recombinase/integrase [Afipia sp.]
MNGLRRPSTGAACGADSQSWTTAGFNSSWKTVRQRLLDAGAASPGLTLKGLRHTVATILAEMGMDDRTIADMLGQRTF